MSFDDWLIHTCTIENPGTGTTNAYNNTVPGYGTPVTGVKCRLIEKQERIWVEEIQESVVQTVYRMLFGSGTTLTEGAKISLVTLEDSTALSDRFEVVEILARRASSLRHISAKLERIS